MRSYEQQQIARLGDHDSYRIKLWSDSGETKTLNVNRGQFVEIVATLTRDERQAVQSGADSARGLIFLYDPEREVAAFDWGFDGIEVTTAGSWKPMEPYGNAIIHQTIHVGQHEQSHEHLWEVVREAFGR